MARISALLALAALLVVVKAQNPTNTTVPTPSLAPSPNVTEVAKETEQPEVSAPAAAPPTSEAAANTTAVADTGKVAPPIIPTNGSSPISASPEKRGGFRGRNALIAVIVLAVIGVLIGVIIMRRRRARQRNAVPIPSGAEQPGDYPF